MKQLKYFIGGIATILLIIPLCDNLSQLIDVWFEKLKIKQSKQILETSKDMIVLQEFIAPNYNYIYDNVDSDDYED